MIRASQGNPTITATAVAILAMVAAGARIGGICPSDWDKRETPVVSAFLTGTYQWRFQAQRRGQDANNSRNRRKY
jgi:hypothetical protein